MLVTRQAVLRRFWYPVMPMALLDAGPKPFRLLGCDIVLWKDGAGRPAAAIDRCCHRTARLSLGHVEDGALVCAYHGWAYDRDGACVRIPQRRAAAPPAGIRIEAYRAAECYGYAWVALAEPLVEIPDLPEARDPCFRSIAEFYETWDTAALRLMENEFDNAHIAFVHRATFGDVTQPMPAANEFTETETGFRVHTVIPVANREIGRTYSGLEGSTTVRDTLHTWWMPFARKLHITYPNGLQHVIFTAGTPIDDGRTQLVQFCLRNDRDSDVPAEKVVAFDRQVTLEDKAILESTDPDVPLDRAGRLEFDMPSDRPGLMMRRQLLALLHAHGESEVRRDEPPGPTSQVA